MAEMHPKLRWAYALLALSRKHFPEVQPGPAPLDLKANLTVCDCEFTPYVPINCAADEALVVADTEKSTHYLRQCLFCGHQWYGHHCPHDGYQNPCGECGKRPETVITTAYGEKEYL